MRARQLDSRRRSPYSASMTSARDDQRASETPDLQAAERSVFVDANAFIQARDLKDVDWCGLFPGVRKVEIMVTPSVIGELDAKKNDSKDRVRNRARAALRQIDAASEAEPMRVVLKDEPVVVSLNVPWIAPVDWTRHPTLDPTRPDDQLVAQATAAQTVLPKVLLTHDSGPRITARRAGLQAMTIPSGWLLPDPVDDDRRKIQRLQRENEALRARAPAVTVTWTGDAAQGALVERLVVAPFTDEQVTAMVNATLLRSPRATATLTVGSGFAIGEDDIWGVWNQRDYDLYCAKYADFADGLRAFFKELPKRVARVSGLAEVGYCIANEGSATADNVIVSLRVGSGWSLLPDEQAEEGGPIFAPAPPLTPSAEERMQTARKADRVARSLRLSLPPAQTRRDPTGWFWVDRPKWDGGPATFECAELRAGRERLDVVRMLPEPAPSEAKLTIDVHASNLSAPILLEQTFRFRDRPAGWCDHLVQDLLEPWLGEAIRAAVGVG